METLIDVAQPDVGELSQRRFDYGQIPAGHRERVVRAAEVIREASEAAVDSIVRIGRELAEVKKRLGHGQFTEWIAAEFELSERMAQNYMNVARTYGDEAKAKRVSLFGPSVIYLLAAPSTPDEVREQVEVQFAETGIVPTRAEVKALRDAQKPAPPPPLAEPVYIRPTMPETLSEQGYRLIDIGNGLWRWEQAHFRSEPFHTSAEAVKDAYRDFDKAEAQADPAPLPMTTRDEPTPNYVPVVPDDPEPAGEPSDEELAAIAAVEAERVVEDGERAAREVKRQERVDAAWADVRQMQQEAAAVFAPTQPDTRLVKAKALRHLLATTRSAVNASYGELCGKYTYSLAWFRGCEVMIERLDSLIDILSGKDGA